MMKRLFAASFISVALAATSAGVVANAETVTTAPATAVTQATTTLTHAATQASTATASTSAPTIVCARGFEILCTVLGYTLCRARPCGIDTATPSRSAETASTSSPAIACEIQLMCTVLGKLCHTSCTTNTHSMVVAASIRSY